MMKKLCIGLCASVAAGFATASAAPVDLSTWTAQGGGSWAVAADNNSVFQSLNGDPAVFFNGQNSQGLALSGTITVETNGDDDYIGFVLGYNAGDISNPNPNYILIDWKQLDQGGFFGCTAQAGLAISRVTGPLPDGAGAWCHNPTFGVTELARAATLGDTGWVDNTTYNFSLTFTDTLIQVFVNGALELSVNGSFANGSFGFYNYSQASVRYAGIQQDPVDPTPEVPLPMALPLMALGLAGLGGARAAGRRRV